MSGSCKYCKYAPAALRLLTGVLYCGLVTPAAALDPTRSIQQYAHGWYQDQLPQNTVLDILQRRDGSMWFATYSGVVRHSGAGFSGLEQQQADLIESRAIQALLEDAAGTLWIGTLNGGLYRIGEHEVQPVRVDLPESIDSVYAIVQDASGALWMGTNAGILRLDAEGTRLFAREQGISRFDLRSMTVDAQGSVWVAMDVAGVARFRDGALDIFGVSDGLPDPGALYVHADHSGVLWVGTRAGLLRFRDGRFERMPTAAALDGKRVYMLLDDHDGNLWIAAEDRGLCRLNASGLQCADDIAGLSNDVLRSIREDREGNLWIGTTASGVHRLSDSKLATVVGALASNSVRAVCEDAAGVVWAGTDGAGLAIVRGGALWPFANNTALPSAFVRALHGDAKGNLWVGSISGLSRVDPDGRVSNYGGDSGLPSTVVFAIISDGEGGLWIGTDLGLARMQEGRISAIELEGPNNIRALHLDRNGRLWIGHRSGLQCLPTDVPAGVRRMQSDFCGVPDGLARISVFAFHEAADGAMWIGTSAGLVRLRDGGLVHYSERDGLVGSEVFTIIDDGAGSFWTSSNRGIARLTQDDFAAFDRGEIPALRPRAFDKRDGMLSNQGNGASQSPGLRARDGRLWIATVRGLVMVEPYNLRRNELSPLVAVERVVVDTLDLAPQRVRRIGPGAEKLEFHYAAMSYVSPEAVRYRYRLEGFDRDWVDAGARRVAYYTNLSPGDYTFRVIAANNDEVWNSSGATVAFRIAPRYYETRWFRVLLGLAALAVLVGAYRFRLWRLRSNERELMRVVAQRTEALKQANIELTRMASHDGLTRIANRSAFDAALAELWEDHRQRGASLAILICDVDLFKAYNDAFGHQAGDRALIRVAATLQAQARLGADVAARYGGEEFAMLLANLSLPEAAVVAERLLDAVRQLGIPHRSSSVAPHITLSIGVTALVPSADVTFEQAIQAADQALYLAKEQGRDRAVAATVTPADMTANT